MLYGLHFGGVILQTQRDGITAITRIEQFQMEQVYQLRQISDRLDRIEAQLEAAGGG